MAVVIHGAPPPEIASDLGERFSRLEAELEMDLPARASFHPDQAVELEAWAWNERFHERAAAVAGR